MTTGMKALREVEPPGPSLSGGPAGGAMVVPVAPCVHGWHDMVGVIVGRASVIVTVDGDWFALVRDDIQASVGREKTKGQAARDHRLGDSHDALPGWRRDRQAWPQWRPPKHPSASQEKQYRVACS